MSLRLQRFDFRSSGYERPNQGWYCGRLREGKPCLLGPTAQGQCRGGHECAPQLEGGRWRCTRPVSMGGACSDGPLPDGTCTHAVRVCKPARSTRRLRRSVVFWTVSAIVLALFVTLDLFPTITRATVSPGPLSARHASIANCKACHGTDPGGIADILAKAVHGKPRQASAVACASCHQAEARNAAHNLTPATLAALARGVKATDNDVPVATRIASTLGVPPRDDPAKPNSCLSCHVEHVGVDGAITPVTNVTCNRCHAVRFSGMSAGHPAFPAGFPDVRRQRIQFDHNEHLNKNFKSPTTPKNGPKVCSDCHAPDATGEHMLIKGFDAACAACHRSDLERQTVILFGLPGLDLETLAARKARVGEWPREAELESVPPLVDLLLSGNADYVAARKALSTARVDLLDLRDAKPEQLLQVETVAWSIKRLLDDIDKKGMAALLKAASERYGVKAEPPSVAALADQVPVDSIRLLRAKSFPDLAKELADIRRTHRRAPTRATSLPPRVPAGGVQGWVMSDGALRYAFSGHDRPAVMRGLIDLVVNADLTRHDDASARARTAFAGKKSPGRCATCHSVDATPKGGIQVNWRAFDVSDDTTPLTAFRHAPHITAFKGACTSCHAIDTKADFAGGYADADPMKFASNFKPLTTAACAQCHNPGGAGDRCSDCHTYHAALGGGRPGPRVARR